MKKAKSREKSAQKSGDITKTPARNLSAAIMPNAKKASEREQDPPQKSRSMRKKGLLKFFGEGPCVPAPTTEGTLIKAVTKWRDKRSGGNTNSKKRESVKSDESAQRKKTRSDEEESEKHEVDHGRMEKCLSRRKGRETKVLRRKRRRRIRRKANPPKRKERTQSLQKQLERRHLKRRQ